MQIILFGEESQTVPRFEAVQGLFYTLLVVLDHVGVHLRIVAPYIPLCASIGHCTEAKWWVLLLGLLELSQARCHKINRGTNVNLI